MPTQNENENDIEREIAKLVSPPGAAVDRIYGAKRNGPLALRQAPPAHEFVSLAEQLAKGLVEAAQAHLSNAQSKLDECQQMANELRDAMERKSRELADMTGRLNSFGEQVLDAHRKFHEPAQSQEAKHDER